MDQFNRISLAGTSFFLVGAHASLWRYLVYTFFGPYHFRRLIYFYFFFQYGQDFGDEYFAELDLIEVVERNKEGYESDIDEEDEIEGDVEVLSDQLETNSTTDEESMDTTAPNGAADTPGRIRTVNV